MTPAQIAAARRLAETEPGRTRYQPEQQPESPPPLRVVPGPQRRAPRLRWAALISFALLAASLLAVVVAHAMLAQEQVRMTQLQSKISAAQAQNKSEQARIARMEAPSRISRDAQKEHLAVPGQVAQVPSVPLTKPIPLPTVSPTTSTTAAGG